MLWAGLDTGYPVPLGSLGFNRKTKGSITPATGRNQKLPTDCVSIHAATAMRNIA